MTRFGGGLRHGRSMIAVAIVVGAVTACSGGTSASSTPGAATIPAGTATTTAAAPTTAATAVSDREPNCQNMTADAVTLNYWDDANENLSDAGVAKLDAAFRAKYPNVTLNRTAKTLNDILSTEKLQASGPHPPDLLI